YEGRALNRGERRALLGRAWKGHDILRSRHDREDGTLRLRRWLRLRGRSRRRLGRHACAVTAHAKAPIALEAAVAIEDRQTGEFDAHRLAGRGGPREHDPAEGIARRDRGGHA